jgi:hypothetical protein
MASLTPFFIFFLPFIERHGCLEIIVFPLHLDFLAAKISSFTSLASSFLNQTNRRKTCERGRGGEEKDAAGRLFYRVHDDEDGGIGDDASRISWRL